MCSSSEANNSAKALPDAPCSGGSTPCVDNGDDVSIVSVEFLDGSDDKILSGEAEHFVNLSADAKWVDGKVVKNKDRLSMNPRIKVKFNKPGAHSFKLKYIPDGGNAAYSEAEKARNPNFKFESTEKEFTTGSNGELIVKSGFNIDSAGNNKYAVQATDKKGKTVKSSGKIKTLRLIYYVEIKMTGLTTAAGSLSTLKAEYLSNYIKLEGLAATTMVYMQNISTTDTATFITNASNAFKASDGEKKKPYCLGIAYTDHLAVKNQGTVIVDNVEVGPGKPAKTINIIGPGLNDPALSGKALWQQLVTGEDWFISCSYLKSGDTPDKAVSISKDKLTPSGANNSYSVTLNVTSLPAGKGKITLKVNWVDRMRAGIALGGNLIAVCTRAWWTTISTADQNQIMIHEIGHKVGMAATGTGNEPDKIPNYYDAKGHVGPHCHKGLPSGQTMYNSTTDNSNSKCVMYGATNGKTAFCGDCKPAVRKLDLSSGW